MNVHELMLRTNHQLIREGALSADESGGIFRSLIAERDIPKWIHLRPRALQPLFYRTEGEMLPTVLYQKPKTQLFSANMHELEILRLLCVLRPESEPVKFMVEQTLARLKLTCFGSADDGLGECFDSSLVVLRFLAAAGETQWAADRIENYNRHCGDRRRSWHSKWYYWLCLSELPDDMAAANLMPYRDELLELLVKARYPVECERDRCLRPVMLCILRNAAAKLPGCEYIKNRRPLIDPEDGRICIDIG